MGKAKNASSALPNGRATANQPRFRKSDLEARLRMEQDQLASALALGPSERELTEDGLSAGDNGGELESREIEYSHRSAMRQRFRQLQDALDRVQSGAYGRCAECGNTIDRRRLISEPAALLCASCQASHESDIRPVTL